MSTEAVLTVSQRIVQVCLVLAAAIAIFGGSLQFHLDQPDTSPRLDNGPQGPSNEQFCQSLTVSDKVRCQKKGHKSWA